MPRDFTQYTFRVQARPNEAHTSAELREQVEAMLKAGLAGEEPFYVLACSKGELELIIAGLLYAEQFEGKGPMKAAYDAGWRDAMKDNSETMLGKEG